MSKPMIRIHNLETNEVIDREMTNEEYNHHLISLQPAPLTEAEQIAKAAKEAAQVKLAALGLTTDDLKALGL